MTVIQAVAALWLGTVYIAALGADIWTPVSYSHQFREHIEEHPGQAFPLGTDSLGRDRLSRLVFGARVSLILAPAAACLSTLAAGALGIIAAFYGGWIRRGLMACVDLVLAVPWFFLLLTMRALLPLNTSPWVSLLITFGVLGGLGWAGPARVVRAGAEQLLNADFILAARGRGVRELPLMARHLLPNLRPVLLAQFWTSVPLFILAESSLGFLGLGVEEPLPSLGGLLRELESYSKLATEPWILAPAVLLTSVVLAFQLIMAQEDCTR